MEKDEITFEQKLELSHLCQLCSSKKQGKCQHNTKGGIHECICFRKRLAFNIARVEYERRKKKGEIIE